MIKGVSLVSPEELDILISEKSSGYQQRSHRLDELIDRIATTKVQHKVLNKLIRYTLGEQKTTATVSVRSLQRKIGCGKNSISRAMINLEGRGILTYIYKSDRRGTPSVIELNWIRQFIRENQSRSNVVYVNFNNKNETPVVLKPPQEPMKQQKNAVKNTCLEKTVPILGTKEREYYIEYSFLDSISVSEIKSLTSVESELKSVKAAQALTARDRLDCYRNLRKLLTDRWNRLVSLGKASQAISEKSLFSKAKLEFPRDLNLIYLTLLKFEKSRMDFNGYQVLDPISKIEKKWTGMREYAFQHFSSEATDLASLSFEDYHEKLSSRRDDAVYVSSLKPVRAPVQPNTDIEMEEQVRAFCMRFVGDDFLGAVRKWGGAFFRDLNSRPALLAAAGLWFVSESRLKELKDGIDSDRSLAPLSTEVKAEEMPAEVVVEAKVAARPMSLVPRPNLESPNVLESQFKGRIQTNFLIDSCGSRAPPSVAV